MSGRIDRGNHLMTTYLHAQHGSFQIWEQKHYLDLEVKSENDKM
jgi:hypothetical protein